MSFEGPETIVHVLQPKEDLELPLEEYYCISLSSAALDNKAKKGRTTLYSTFRGIKTALCTLQVGVTEQFTCNQTFLPNDHSVVFSCEGPNDIHLVALVQENEDAPPSGDDSDEELEDEDMMKLLESEGLVGDESEDETDEEGEPKIVELEETPAVVEKKVEAKKVAEAVETKKRVAETAKPAEPVQKKVKTMTKNVKGVTIKEVVEGKGPAAKKGKTVKILYRGRLENGKQFDSCKNRKKPFGFRLYGGEVIKGFDIGIDGMRVGGKRTITIPSHLGYGNAGAPPSIPRNATLIFDIELVSA